MLKMKKFIAKFRVMNGIRQYTVPVKIEATNLSGARNKARVHECRAEALELESLREIKTFNDIWRFL